MGRTFVVIVLALAATACSYRARCEDDSCANNAPTAVIRRATDGTLRVAAAVEIIISAADSTDPDGDALSYAWTVDSSCAANTGAGLDDVELHLSNLIAGTQCAIEVTVTDTKGASGSASAVLSVRDVGAHVAATAPCVDSFDPEAETPQGSESQPFCRLSDGLAAAKEFQIAEVALANDAPQALETSLTVDSTVTIRGGYDRNSWQTTDANSDIALGTSATTDISLRIETAAASDTVTLAGLAIYRTAACVAECAIIDDVRSNVVLDDVLVGISRGEPSAVVSLGSSSDNYYSVRVAGSSDTDASPITFTATNLSTSGATTAATSVGIAIMDAVDATISSSTISESSHRVSGVQSLRARSLHIDESTVSVLGDGTGDSLAVGIIDGIATSIGFDTCGSTSDVKTCSSSDTLSLRSVTVSSANAGDAIALAALGTKALTLQSTTATPAQYSATGQRACGVVTMATGREDIGQAGATASSLVINATAVSSDASRPSSVIGWSDGYESTADTTSSADTRIVTLGSYKPQVDSASINVVVGSADVDEAVAIVLRDSDNALLQENTLSLASQDVTRTVTRVAGVRLLRAHAPVIEGGSVAIDNLAASWVVGAVIDGQLNSLNESVDEVDGENFASTNLTIHASDLGGALLVGGVDAAVVPLRTCVALFGTDVATVSDSSIGCTVGLDTGSTPTLAGVLTIATKNVAITNNVIEASTTADNDNARLLGIQDGSRHEDGIGSLGLFIERNRISISAPYAEVVGVRLQTGLGSTPSADATALIDGNFIKLVGSENIGVLAFHVSAIIAFNSVRVAACTKNCSQGYATGFYLMDLTTSDVVQVLANGFSVPKQSFGSESAVPAIVELETNAELRVAAVVDNVYGWEDGYGTPPLLIVVVSNDTTEISPRGYGTYSQETINDNTDAETAEGNIASPPTYCSDGLHGDPSGPQKGAAVHITSSLFDKNDTTRALSDIDGVTRTFPSDSGADIITSCQ